MRPRPPIAMAIRFPMTWLFLHAWSAGDFSSVARRHILMRHHEIGWCL